METEKRVITSGGEMWQAKVQSPGLFVGPVTCGPLNEATDYAIDFTRLDSNGKPDPNEKPLEAICGIPWGVISDAELLRLLNDKLEEEEV